MTLGAGVVVLQYSPNVETAIIIGNRTANQEVETMALQDILREAATLSAAERRELIKSLVDTLVVAETPATLKLPHARRLTELRGLGKEIWRGMDAQEYVNQMRDEWDQHR